MIFQPHCVKKNSGVATSFAEHPVLPVPTQRTKPKKIHLYFSLYEQILWHGEFTVNLITHY